MLNASRRDLRAAIIMGAGRAGRSDQEIVPPPFHLDYVSPQHVPLEGEGSRRGHSLSGGDDPDSEDDDESVPEYARQPPQSSRVVQTSVRQDREFERSTVASGSMAGTSRGMSIYIYIYIYFIRIMKRCLM